MAEQSRALARTTENKPAPIAGHKSNLISLSEEVTRLTPFHVIKTKSVQLNPDPTAGDVYDAKFIEDGLLGLAKNGLFKLIRTAGAILVPELCKWTVNNGLVYPQSGGAPPAYIEQMKFVWNYTAVLMWAGADGRPMPAIGSREVDLRDDSDAIAQIKDSCKNVGWKIAKQVKQAREFAPLMAETKAILRACRQILQVKPAYTAKELSQPFVVQCFEFSPDLSDPEVRAMVIDQGQSAAAALYGGATATATVRPALSAPTSPETFPAEGIGFDPDDAGPDWDRKTGEVIDPDATEVQEAEEVADVPPDTETATRAFLSDIASAEDNETLNGISTAIKAMDGLTPGQRERLSNAFKTARARVKGAA